MWFSRRSWTPLVATLLAVLPFTSAEYMLTSNSLASCQANSSFGASLFEVTFTPSNNTLAFNIVGTSTITGNVTLDIVVDAYGLQIYQLSKSPCDLDLLGMCPMTAGPLTVDSVLTLPASVIKDVPTIAYTVPDLDATVKLVITSADTGISLACVEAKLSNGKSVYVPAVCWVLAIIVGLGLVASAITSGLGNTLTSTQVSANSVSMFGYFQSQAMLGMLAIPYPPIVASWTQDFQWSMGIIKVGFVESIATWYDRATGGTPSTVLSSLSTVSVEVEKRSLGTVHGLLIRSVDMVKRATSVSDSTNTDSSTLLIYRGIKRVGFRAGIEMTNIFLTGYIFFLIFVVFVVICVLAFKFACDLLVKSGKMNNNRFEELRFGWKTTLKGILFRVALISFPQLVILCFWEMVEHDSAGEVAIAIITIITVLGLLVWASIKVLRMAHNAKKLAIQPIQKLFADPMTFNKWGFLYVQYNANKNYSFFTFTLVYVLVKCLFVAFGQSSGTVQAFAFLVIEIVSLAFVAHRLPYMNFATNFWNIAILVISLVNAIFLVFFTGITHVPGIAIGVMGVILFVMNAIFALVLLIMLLVASVQAIVLKDPDRKHPEPKDLRGSFVRSQQSFEELNALKDTALGKNRGAQGSDSGSGRGSAPFGGAEQRYSEKEGLYASPPYNRADSHSPAPLREGDDERGYQRIDNNAVNMDWDKQGVGY